MAACGGAARWGAFPSAQLPWRRGVRGAAADGARRCRRALPLGALAALFAALLAVTGVAFAAAEDACPSRVPQRLSGARSDLSMRARLLRGTLLLPGGAAGGEPEGSGATATCEELRVARLEVHTADGARWAAHGDPEATPRQLLDEGLAVSADELSGSLDGSEAYSVPLLEGVAWGDVEYLFLYEPPREGTEGLVLGSAPVAALLREGDAEPLVHREPTVLDSCLSLGHGGENGGTTRVRWSVDAGLNVATFAIEAVAAPGSWAAFGPANPNANNRLMGGADAAVLTLADDDATTVAVEDYFLTSYLECDYANGGGDGVCDDATLGGESSVEPLLTQYSQGVALAVFSRPWAAAEPETDVPLAPSEPRPFVWARGATMAQGEGAGGRSALGRPGVAKHAALVEQTYGELFGLRLAEITWQCSPLAGVLPPGARRGEADEAPASAVLDGLSTPVLLHNGGAQVAWRLDEAAGTATFGVQMLRPGSYAALAIGTLMSNAFAYVAIREGVGSYRMTGYKNTDVVPLCGACGDAHELTDVVVETDADGYLSFRFTRPLAANVASGEPEIEIGGGARTPLMWAAGDNWGAMRGADLGPPPPEALHTSRSKAAAAIDLATGDALIAQADARLVWHGIAMGLAWLISMPVGLYAARHMRNALGGGQWLLVHRFFSQACMALTLVGVALAVAEGEDRRRHLGSAHSLWGTVVAVIAAEQAISGHLRPPNVGPGHPEYRKRTLWSLFHRLQGAGCAFAAVGATITGLQEMQEWSSVAGLANMGWLWFALLLAAFGAREARKQWVLRAQQQQDDVGKGAASPAALRRRATTIRQARNHASEENTAARWSDV